MSGVPGGFENCCKKHDLVYSIEPIKQIKIPILKLYEHI